MIELDHAAPEGEPLGDAIARDASDDEIARAFLSQLVRAGRAEAAEASASAAERFETAARSIMLAARHDPSGAAGEIATLASNLRTNFEKKYLGLYLTHILGKLSPDTAFYDDLRAWRGVTK